MTVVKINIKALRCTCELQNCPGGGKPWISEGTTPPKKCRWCKRITWNGQPDRRKKPERTPEEIREYYRIKQQESRARRKKKRRVS